MQGQRSRCAEMFHENSRDELNGQARQPQGRARGIASSLQQEAVQFKVREARG